MLELEGERRGRHDDRRLARTRSAEPPLFLMSCRAAGDKFASALSIRPIVLRIGDEEPVSCRSTEGDQNETAILVEHLSAR